MSGEEYKIVNVVSKFNIGVKNIDLEDLINNINLLGTYSKYKFRGLVFSSTQNLPGLVCLFSSGTVMMKQSKMVESSMYLGRLFVKKVLLTGIPAVFKDFEVDNIVGSFNCGFCVKLYDFVNWMGSLAEFDPKLFSGVIVTWYNNDKTLSFLVFRSGQVIVAGAKEINQSYKGYEWIKGKLQQFKDFFTAVVLLPEYDKDEQSKKISVDTLLLQKELINNHLLQNQAITYF